MGGTNVLKKSDLSYKQGEDSGISHLYRMVLKPDNTVRVEIDEEKIYEGSIKEDWEVLKPKEIPDPDDKKPEDWVDSSMMDDPEDKKPDDWDDEEDGGQGRGGGDVDAPQRRRRPPPDGG